VTVIADMSFARTLCRRQTHAGERKKRRAKRGGERDHLSDYWCVNGPRRGRGVGDKNAV
jgi:hypothetical protein